MITCKSTGPLLHDSKIKRKPLLACLPTIHAHTYTHKHTHSLSQRWEPGEVTEVCSLVGQLLCSDEGQESPPCQTLHTRKLCALQTAGVLVETDTFMTQCEKVSDFPRNIGRQTCRDSKVLHNQLETRKRVILETFF